MTILIIDDHAAMRQTIRQVLTAPGVAFLEGGNGRDAVRLCCEHRPDWVLMDLALPQRNGIAATAEIHRLCPAVRVAVVTDYDDAYTRAAASEAGACAFVPKERLVELRGVLGVAAEAGAGASATAQRDLSKGDNHE